MVVRSRAQVPRAAPHPSTVSLSCRFRASLRGCLSISQGCLPRGTQGDEGELGPRAGCGEDRGDPAPAGTVMSITEGVQEGGDSLWVEGQGLGSCSRSDGRVGKGRGGSGRFGQREGASSVLLSNLGPPFQTRFLPPWGLF